MSTTNNQLENVWVRIRGTQRQDGETEVSETVLCTQARFYRRKGVYYIIYEESEATGYGGCRTMLSFEPNVRLRMTRTGPVRSSLLLELGKRNVGCYFLESGELQIGVFAQEMDGNLTDDGGEFVCTYQLDVNSLPMSENTLQVQIQREPVKEGPRDE